jgi:hypothetical protein
MRKLPLFLAILLILEELLPLVVIYAVRLSPTLLSTCAHCFVLSPVCCLRLASCLRKRLKSASRRSWLALAPCLS